MTKHISEYLPFSYEIDNHQSFCLNYNVKDKNGCTLFTTFRLDIAQFVIQACNKYLRSSEIEIPETLENPEAFELESILPWRFYGDCEAGCLIIDDDNDHVAYVEWPNDARFILALANQAFAAREGK